MAQFERMPRYQLDTQKEGEIGQLFREAQEENLRRFPYIYTFKRHKKINTVTIISLNALNDDF